MRFQTVTRTARILGASLFSVSLANLAVPSASIAQNCNLWGCSAPGAGECTIWGCPAPPPQPQVQPQQAPSNIIIIPGNTTPIGSTTSSSIQPQSNPQQVAACIRELHSFYYQGPFSSSEATTLAQNACQSGASASCIQETYTYYYWQTPASSREAPQLAQQACTPSR